MDEQNDYLLKQFVKFITDSIETKSNMFND